MSALDEYRRRKAMPREVIGISVPMPEKYADAAIAELEAEKKELTDEMRVVEACAMATHELLTIAARRVIAKDEDIAFMHDEGGAALYERVKTRAEQAEDRLERTQLLYEQAEAALMDKDDDYWRPKLRLLQDDRAKAERRAEEAEAEVERLKCCGNCGYLFDDCGQGLCGWANPSPTQVGSPHVNFADPCFRAPSRWQRRES
jgi:hypothetical protein